MKHSPVSTSIVDLLLFVQSCRAKELPYDHESRLIKSAPTQFIPLVQRNISDQLKMWSETTHERPQNSRAQETGKSTHGF